MHDDGVADRVAFGIERLLHDERAFVPTFREDGSSFAALEFQTELRLPGGENRLGKLQARIKPPAVPSPGLRPCPRPARLRGTRPPPCPGTGRPRALPSRNH